MEQQKAHIFLIDDSPLIAKANKILLQYSGFEVTTCTDEREAVGILKNNPNLFQLVLTDQLMPHITGIALAGEIKKLYPSLPIVLITGEIQPEQCAQAEQVGIAQCLVKPIPTETLIQAINSALEY